MSSPVRTICFATLLLAAACGPAVVGGEDSQEGGGSPVSAHEMMLEGRFGIAYQTEQAIEFLGSAILREGGGGDFIPGWVCDEGVRYELAWAVEEAASDAVVRMDVVAMRGEEAVSITASGSVGDCLDSALQVSVAGETWNGLAFPTDGQCLAGLVGVVCTEVPCDEDLQPICDQP